MTKAKPPPPSRRSSRISQKDKKVSVSKLPKNKLNASLKLKKKVVNILDFKKQAGKTMYLVERDGSSLDAWETEDMIESLDILTDYQQKVQNESGYSINAGSVRQPEGLENPRPSRLSKTRAVMALKQHDCVLDDYLSDDNDISQKAKTNTHPKKPANRRQGKKTKAEALADIQRTDRLNRQKERLELNPDEIIDNMTHFYGKECCLKCAANTYRDALETNDMKLLETALNDKEIPSHDLEDKPNGLSFIQYAIVLQREVFAEVVEKHDKADKSSDYPNQFLTYNGGDTGRNHGFGAYHNRSFRRVEESRGNRVGNSAFYKESESKRTFMNVEDNIRSSKLCSFMHYISKDAFRNEKVIENYLVHFSNGPRDVYYAASAGSRLLAKSLLQQANVSGRSTFNLLHEEVLQFENGEPLTSYKRNQILKMASDAFNVTPYHLSAINPRATYLSELFEALDPAERMQTDIYGRSVAFFAAVSETSDCLEFLESKSFNFSVVDKYKMSPLLQAARYGRSHNIEILIRNIRGGPEVTETSPFIFQSLVRNRRTALHYAAYFGHAEACSVLIRFNAPVECLENLEKQTPLLYAAKNGNVDCVRVIIEEGKANPEKGDKFSRTPLHHACMNGHTEVVKYLLSRGVNANAYDSSHNTPIHFAAAFGYIKIVHLLIQYGFSDPTPSNVWRSTPCSVANMKGHIGVVKYLLGLTNFTIDVNFKDQDGYTMLHRSINETASNPFERKTNIEKITFLLSMKADTNSINIEGNTSLHSLVSNIDYVKLRPKGWETFYPVSTSYHTYEEIVYDDVEGVEYQESLAKLLIDHGVNLNIKNSQNETPLVIAMRAGNHHLVSLLIESGAKFWVDTDENGNNFFHYFGDLISSINGLQPHYDLDIMIKERFVNVAKKIWASVLSCSTSHMSKIKAMVNERNKKGYTPLIYGVHSAIQKQKEAMVREKYMIKSAISNNSEDDLGYIPRYCAVNKEYPSRMFEKATLPLDVKLTFSFDLFIIFMRDLIKQFKPNMNDHVELPFDYKKENPKAKKSKYPNLTGYTALHIAAQTQNTELINFLLENGSDPNMRVELENEILSGDTPFIIAYHDKKDLYQEMPETSPSEYHEIVKKKFTLTKPDFKEILYQTIGSFIRFKGCPFITNSFGCSVLSKASASLDSYNFPRICNAVPSKDANVNSKNEKQETSLMMTINSLETAINQKEEKPQIEIVKYLLKINADPNVQYENGDTVLMKIIKIANVSLLEILIEYSLIAINHNLKNKRQENALIIACKQNNSKVTSRYLSLLKSSTNSCELNTLDCEKSSALCYAAKNGDLQVVEELLLLNADPNFNMAQHVPLIEAVVGQNIDVVKLLLMKGAFVDKKDEPNGNSALHNAVLAGKHRIVKLLLEYSADYDITNNRLQSPMHLAVQTTKHQTNRNFRTECLLMNAGANVNAVDIFGRTPLHYLFVESNMIPITRETTITSKTVDQISNQMKIMQNRIEALENFTCEFDLVEFLDGHNDGDTYLNAWMKEAKKIQLEKSEEKLQNPITEEERNLMKVYHGYEWEEQQSVPPRFDPIDMLKYLSDSKDLQKDIRDEFGRTPLHYAACVGAFSCTALLAKHNVDVNAMDSDNNGPLHLALRHNYVDYSVMLCNLGANVNNNIFLKDGKSMSTFGFSLSQSFINMAYLIMDKGVNPIESIRESLKTGKFHIAEILLNSLGDKCLSSALPVENQNIWHVVSDFKPFNVENWEEYVEDIIEKLLSLNIPIIKDIYGRTPVHCAAKHGQITLLRRILANSGIQINIVDKDGHSELDYAANSGLIESVQALLDAGANVFTTNNQLPSLVLKTVQLKKHDITELLLKYGASTDEDSKYGRTNAVMTACQNKDLEMLNILINHYANLDTPSFVERKDDAGKKYSVLLHPIFAASYPGSTLLEVMLKSNVNPNVYGPESKPEHGMPCFMYNVAIGADTNQRTLLKYNIDLDVIDPNTSRSIFYQFVFRKIEYDDEFQITSNINYNNMHFDDVIYRTMLRNFKPEINTVDKITGMTPLEYAINEKNTFIVEQLLTLGANINIESCNKTNNTLFSSALNRSFQKLPAIIHAITKNNLDLLKLIFKHAQEKVNWMWHDEEKRNALSFIIGSADGFSHDNVNVLEFLFNQMKPATFKRLLKMKDIHGFSPTDYAFQRRNKGLYEAIVRLEPTEKIDELYQDGTHDKEHYSLMDIDYISTQTVDQDAAIEREILQKEKDLEKARDKSTSIQETNEAVQVDQYSNLERVGYVVLDENEQAYDIVLIKVELLGWGAYTNTLFYKMSIIYNKILDINILWTRWGSYGQEGQHQKTPYLNLDEAVAEFKSIFKSKTGNVWENRSTSFSQKRDRYGILKTSHHPRDVILKNFSFLNSSIPADLPHEVVNVMKLICNYTYLSRVYSGFNVDMPLGQVSQKTIENARQVLADVQNMQIKLKEAKAQYSNKSKLLEAREWEFKIAQKCVEYARLLPRKDSGHKPVRSLLNSNLKEELSMIEDLSYVGFAANVILAAKHHINSTNPLQYAYQALNCSLRNIESDAAEHQLIKMYIQSTSNGNYDLVHLLGVNRADEENRFRPFEKEENRMLLWHGSRIGNFMGILKQGLRVCPRTSSLNGAMLGSGIYFADTFMKSLNYSTENYGSQKSSYRLLLLCEVALGPKSVFYNDLNQGIETTTYDHVKGEGSKIPDPNNAIYDKDGLCIPIGPCISYTRTITENNKLVEVPLLSYNEFAVHDENRVKIRYLLIFRESANCFLCSKPDENLKALYEQDIKDYNYSAFNSFEKEVVKAYLTHQNQSPQDIFDYELNDFIKSELYKKKWETPLDLCRDSKVCHKCTKGIVALMLEKRLTSIDVDIPECLQNKPHCEYGKECRTQSKIAHAKKYQHWFKENVSEEDKNIQATISEIEADEDGDSTEDEDDNEDRDEDCMDTDDE